jgi:hypothetical protein
MYIPSETVLFSFDDEKETILGKAFVEKFGYNVFTFKFSKETVIEENTEYDINVVVQGNSVIGKGSKKYRYAILQSINEYKAGERNGGN